MRVFGLLASKSISVINLTSRDPRTESPFISKCKEWQKREKWEKREACSRQKKMQSFT